MIDGLVIIDKPAGITSHDVVSRVRRLAGTRKVGHAGTLDPMATGVLVLGINRATRLLGHLSLTDKAYDATIRLGASTSTDDAEGDVVATTSTDGVDEDAVRAGLATMVGEIEQRPSSVSAIKVDGKRAYQRVRDGEEVVLPARRVRISSLEVSRIERVADFVEVDISVRCSSGTYIRAIARDLGESLAVGGNLTALRRIAVGEFSLASAQTLEQATDELVVTPIAVAARASFPSYELDEGEAADVRVGRKLELTLPASPCALFEPGGAFLALYEQSGATARAVAVFV